MAGIVFVKRSELPVSVKGKVSTLQVTITGSGQLQFSKLAVDELTPKVAIAFQGLTLMIFRTDSKLGAKVPAENLFELKHPKSGKGSGAFIGAANMFRNEELAKASGRKVYDFKASGNQTFVPTVDKTNGCLKFDLAEGALTPKPVVHRVKKIATGVAAVPSSISGTPVNQSGNDEIVLDDVA